MNLPWEIPIPALYDHLDDLAWSPDGQRLAIATEKHILIVNFSRAEIENSWQTACSQLRYSPDGSLLVGTGSYKGIYCWDPDTGNSEWTTELQASSIGFTEQGKQMVSVTLAEYGEISYGKRPVIIVRVNLKGYQIRERKLDSMSEYLSPPHSACASDNEIILYPVDSVPGMVCKCRPVGTGDALWYREEMEILHDCPIRNVVYSPDNKRIGLVGDEGTIVMFNRESGKREYKIRSEGEFAEIAFSPDGNRFAHVSGSTVKIRRTEGGNLTNALKINDSYLANSCSFSPDGNHLALTSSSGCIVVFPLNVGSD